MRIRLARAAVVLLAATLAGTVALAQHHHHHHHHHGDDAPVDAGTEVATAADAGVSAAHAPTQTQSDGGAAPCISGTRVIAMRVPPSDAARPCHENADCGIAQAACCPPCGVVGERDVVAVEISAVTEWNASLCDDDTTCARCASHLSPTVSATCIEGLCEVMVRDDCSSGPGPTHAPDRR